MLHRLTCLQNLQDYTSAAADFMQAQILEPSNRSFEVRRKRTISCRLIIQWQRLSTMVSEPRVNNMHLYGLVSHVLQVNFKGIYDIRWVVLCPPGEEKDYEAA